MEQREERRIRNKQAEKTMGLGILENKLDVSNEKEKVISVAGDAGRAVIISRERWRRRKKTTRRWLPLRDEGLDDRSE